MRIAIQTLGCKVNQIESEQIKAKLTNRGYQVVGFHEWAEVYIINTCTVTHISDRKSRAYIRRAARTNPDAIIAAVGCLAQTDAAQLLAMGEIDLIVGNKNKQDIVTFIEEHVPSSPCLVLIDAIDRMDRPERACYYDRAASRTRAFVKIQDGCESTCSYCIVPIARGPMRSKKPEDVLQEVQQIVDLGYREIVLSGINLGFYGVDLNGWNLEKILHHIVNILGTGCRVRLSSIEPGQVSQDIIAMVREYGQICPHFHIPLQSGSERILHLMKRPYTTDDYQKLIGAILSHVPGAAVTSDIMTGFPGETEQDFQEGYERLQSLPLSGLHVFKYSPRPGTAAASLPGQIKAPQKQVRSDLLLQLARTKQKQFYARFLGQEVTVVVEEEIEPGLFRGMSENNIEVRIPSVTNQQDVIIKARINEVQPGYATAVPLLQSP